MKVAEVVATFPPYPGGTGYVCWHNARQLAGRGHEVTVFTLDFQKQQYTDDPTDIDIVRLKTPLLLGGGGIVPQLYSKLQGFDVVHLHYPFFGGAEYVYLASLLRGQKYLTTYHQDVSGESVFRKIVIGLYETLLMQKIIGRSSRVGMLSDEHLRSSKAANLVDWTRVVEIPNGVDARIFAPREKDGTLIRRYGLQDKTVILFVGHLKPFKGLPVLIEALAMMQGDNVALLVVGVGPLEEEYRKLAANKGLADRVIFCGYQSQLTELPRYYNTCDFLVLPSIGAPESFGMVTIEAMASGKPAIVSSLPGPRQLVNDGTDGLVARTGDAHDLKEKIEYLLRERGVREAMGKTARQKILRLYSWERIGGRLETILKEMVL